MAPQEPPPDQRTGDNNTGDDMDVTVEPTAETPSQTSLGTMAQQEPPQDQRTGDTGIIPLVSESRRTSMAVSEPEPQPPMVPGMQIPSGTIFIDSNSSMFRTPQRRHEQRPGPYDKYQDALNAEDTEPWDCPTLPHTIRVNNLKRMAGEEYESDYTAVTRAAVTSLSRLPRTPS